MAGVQSPGLQIPIKFLYASGKVHKSNLTSKYGYQTPRLTLAQGHHVKPSG
jgi:hypothetical protein